MVRLLWCLPTLTLGMVGGAAAATPTDQRPARECDQLDAGSLDAEALPKAVQQRLIGRPGRLPFEASIRTPGISYAAYGTETKYQLVGASDSYGKRLVVRISHAQRCGEMRLVPRSDEQGRLGLYQAAGSDTRSKLYDIGAPWAFDSGGKRLQTRYRIDGDDLLQIVDTRAAVGRVTFDPTYSPDTGPFFDFQVPCKAHDYCYDLRKAGFSGTVTDDACDD